MNLLNLIETMQANPTAELVVTMAPGHPAYLRDSINREKFLDGPFEQDDYQPLIDSGKLVGSEELCSVFVLATAATPLDLTSCDLSHIYTAEQNKLIAELKARPGARGKGGHTSEEHHWITEYSAAQMRMNLYFRFFSAGVVVGCVSGVIGFALKDNIIGWVQNFLAHIKN